MPRRTGSSSRPRITRSGCSLSRHPDAGDRRLRGYSPAVARSNARGRLPHGVRPVRDSRVRGRGAGLSAEAGERIAIRDYDEATDATTVQGRARTRAVDRGSDLKRRARSPAKRNRLDRGGGLLRAALDWWARLPVAGIAGRPRPKSVGTR